MIDLLLQAETAPVTFQIHLIFLGILISAVLSLVILLKGIQGYRQTGELALVGIAAGILLLSGAPLLLNLGLVTLTDTSPATVSIVEDLIQLLGLGLILYVIYHT